MKVVLASASPRRRELLSLLISDFSCRAPDIDESMRPGEPAGDYVARLAVEKSWAIDEPGAIVIGADTTVTVDGLILGKPSDHDHAAAMLQQLSGRWHEVLTGVSVRRGVHLISALAKTRVQFSELCAEDINRYLATDEPWDKAGAYAVQGRAGAFVRRIEGSYSAVVGLPLAETREALGHQGVTPEW